MGATAVLLVVTFELWRANLNVPWAYTLDSLPTAMHVKQILSTGWIWHQSQLGAPVGQNFVDFPMPDILMLLQAKIAALFTQDWPVILNGLFLLTYFTVTASAWWVLRSFGISSWTSSIVAVLYAFLPYHSWRFEFHWFLSGYFTVPLAVYLAVRLLLGQPIFAAREEGGWKKYATWMNFRSVVFIILIATSSSYYTVFTLLLIAVSCVGGLILRKDTKSLLHGSIAICLLLVTFMSSLFRMLQYGIERGPNPLLGGRAEGEVEVYGLKLAHMLLPTLHHRIDSFDELRSRYMAEFPLPSEGWSAALGLIGSIGLLWLIASVLVLPLKSGITQSMLLSRAALHQRAFAALSVFLILVATIGGFSTIISLVAFQQVRSWNRVSIFIAFMALAAVGFGIDRMAGWLRERTPVSFSRFAVSGLLLLILSVGIFDQTGRGWIPKYEEIEVKYASDARFVDDIEGRLGQGARVFQLPLMVFPEGAPVGGVNSYELLRPYLHSKEVAWSFGGMEGRLESEWQKRLNLSDQSDFLKDLAASGFTGLYVDNRGFVADEPGRTFIEDLQDSSDKVLGEDSMIVDPPQKRIFFDLRNFASGYLSSQPHDAEKRRSRLFFSAYVLYVDNVGRTERVRTADGGTDQLQWVNKPNAQIYLGNAETNPTDARVRFELLSASEKEIDAVIEWPGGRVENVKVGPRSREFSGVVPIVGMQQTIRISTNAKSANEDIDPDLDPKPLYFGVSNIEVVAP